MDKLPQLVDPEVSRAKFARELDQYNILANVHRQRGWWLLTADFPEVFVVFATPRTKPPLVVFGAILDFTNYDLWAPSVRLVNPFTRQPYTARTLPPIAWLQRRAPIAGGRPRPEVLPHAGDTDSVVQIDRLMQAYGDDEIPFLCIPGVREYHENPGHTGDDWLLHRGQGEGRLFFLLEQLYRYGVEPIRGFDIQMVPQIRIIQGDIPE